MNQKDIELLESAFARFIERAGIQAGDEPHLLFGALAAENEMMLIQLDRLQKQIERLTKPKLIVPEAGPKLIV